MSEESRQQEIAARLREVESTLAGKAALITVSKTFPLSDVRAAYLAGARDFGENKVQDLLDKSQEWQRLYPQDSIRWHFIGGLQSNKMRTLLKVPSLAAIHSLDSLKLLELFAKESAGAAPKPAFFLQVNTSGEAQKGGFEDLSTLESAVKWLQENKLEKQFWGLMTLGKIGGADYLKDARHSFESLKKMKQSLEKSFHLSPLKLSMGMSDDLSVALEVGTDFVRVGSKIFGSRT